MVGDQSGYENSVDSEYVMGSCVFEGCCLWLWIVGETRHVGGIVEPLLDAFVSGQGLLLILSFPLVEIMLLVLNDTISSLQVQGWGKGWKREQQGRDTQ